MDRRDLNPTSCISVPGYLGRTHAFKGCCGPCRIGDTSLAARPRRLSCVAANPYVSLALAADRAVALATLRVVLSWIGHLAISASQGVVSVSQQFCLGRLAALGGRRLDSCGSLWPLWLRLPACTFDIVCSSPAIVRFHNVGARRRVSASEKLRDGVRLARRRPAPFIGELVG